MDQAIKNLNTVVAIYNTHPELESGVRALQLSGFDMKKLSIVGKHYHTEEHVIGFYNTGDRMMFWGKRGAFWGGFWGLLFGSAMFMMPGLGHLIREPEVSLAIRNILATRRITWLDAEDAMWSAEACIIHESQ